MNKNLYPSIRNAVMTYVNDVRTIDGKVVWVDTTSFDSGNGRANLQKLRDSLVAHYRFDNLEGAVLIGDLPVATYEQWAWDATNRVPIGEDPYPVDYYYMDLVDKDNPPSQYKDSIWLDDHNEHSPEPCSLAYKSGVFDGYRGDAIPEVWVSRIIGNDLYFDSVNGGPDPTVLGSEDAIINRYLDRVHRRMTEIAVTPRRAFLMGDFKNGFSLKAPAIERLGLPYSVIKFPHDTPSKWMYELRDGYEWATIYEHANPEGMNMAQEQKGAWNLDFTTNPAGSGWYIDPDTAKISTKTLFFQDYGCSNVNYYVPNGLGQAYAMLYEGLICMGSTKIYFADTQKVYVDALANDSSFGAAFKKYINVQTIIPASECLTLLGAGTLKLRPYIPSPNPHLVIDSVWATRPNRNSSDPYLHGDTLILHATVRCSTGTPLDTSGLSLKWLGIKDTAWGNSTTYVLEGHNLPMYINKATPGEYFLTLHASAAGYQPATKVLSLPGWSFKKFGTVYPNSTDSKIDDVAHCNTHTGTATDC